WRIPLQQRVGNGYVYASAYLSDEEAVADLSAAVGTPLAEPRLLRFTTGRRRLLWNGNCVALGLASGFLEPLESTSIHLIGSGLYHLLEHFPDRDFDQANIDAYNTRLIEEAETIRDFIAAHYALTQRRDTAFWRYCASMPLPATLRERIELYRGTGRVRARAGELFTELSWFYIFDGLGVEPRAYDPLADIDGTRTAASLERLRGLVQHEVLKARPHDSFFAATAPGAAAQAPRP
ncbi:MAG TPA: tryptophan 7-halogenase, partial [Steroidobacteraceae bacterium]|nr:tryptophan 7-halogenase [Steroidobacteraceae bacterium]